MLHNILYYKLLAFHISIIFLLRLCIFFFFLVVPCGMQDLSSLISLRVCVRNVDQSFLTLCEPLDCSPPGSSVPGISQDRTLE